MDARGGSWSSGSGERSPLPERFDTTHPPGPALKRAQRLAASFCGIVPITKLDALPLPRTGQAWLKPAQQPAQRRRSPLEPALLGVAEPPRHGPTAGSPPRGLHPPNPAVGLPLVVAAAESLASHPWGQNARGQGQATQQRHPLGALADLSEPQRQTRVAWRGSLPPLRSPLKMTGIGVTAEATDQHKPRSTLPIGLFSAAALAVARCSPPAGRAICPADWNEGIVAQVA